MEDAEAYVYNNLIPLEKNIPQEEYFNTELNPDLFQAIQKDLQNWNHQIKHALNVIQKNNFLSPKQEFDKIIEKNVNLWKRSLCKTRSG